MFKRSKRVEFLNEFNRVVDGTVELIGNIQSRENVGADIEAQNALELINALEDVIFSATQVIEKDALNCADAFEAVVAVAELISESLGTRAPQYEGIALNLLGYTYEVGATKAPVIENRMG